MRKLSKVTKCIDRNTDLHNDENMALARNFFLMQERVIEYETAITCLPHHSAEGNEDAEISVYHSMTKNLIDISVIIHDIQISTATVNDAGCIKYLKKL